MHISKVYPLLSESSEDVCAHKIFPHTNLIKIGLKAQFSSKIKGNYLKGGCKLRLMHSFSFAYTPISLMQSLFFFCKFFHARAFLFPPKFPSPGRRGLSIILEARKFIKYQWDSRNRPCSLAPTKSKNKRETTKDETRMWRNMDRLRHVIVVAFVCFVAFFGRSQCIAAAFLILLINISAGLRSTSFSVSKNWILS